MIRPRCSPILFAVCCLNLALPIHAQAAAAREVHSAKASISAAEKAEPELLPGIVLEKFEKNPKAEKAGLREGDVLLTWSRGDISGAFHSPFDLLYVVLEQSPRGTVRLEGIRSGRPVTWELKTDYWGVPARLNFTPRFLLKYREAERLGREGQTTAALKAWHALAGFMPDASAAKTSLLVDAARSLGTSSPAESDRTFQEAAESALEEPAQEIFVYWYWSASAWSRIDHAKALQLCDKSVRYSELSLSELTTASMLIACMVIAIDRGDLDSSENYAVAAREIWEKIAPNSSGALADLISLGSITSDRGNLDIAERYYREALTRSSDSVSVFMRADALWGLGWVMRLRGDYLNAGLYYRSALAIYQRHGAPAIGTAQLVSNLAFLAEEDGDFSTAQDYIEKALQLQTGHRVHSAILSQMGNLRKRQRNFEEAKKYLLEARDIRLKAEPGSLALASTLMDLGDLSRLTNDLVAAEQYFRDAIAIREKNTPGTAELALGLAALAGILEKKHELQQASDLYGAALRAMESQTSRLGGSNDIRSGFRARYADVYRNYVDLLLSGKQENTAFSVLERIRARSMLEILSSAHVELHSGTEPELIKREQLLNAEINAKSNRRIRSMSEDSNRSRNKDLEKQISELLIQYQDVESQIRATSPAYAALTQPQPLTAKEVQTQLLDPDTLLLEYSLGEEHSYVFAVTPDSLQAFELPKRAVVEKAARRVYHLLTARNISVKSETAIQKQSRVALAEAQYSGAAADLSRMILGPVALQLQNKRLLIVTDGALAYIPFSVLPEPQNPPANVPITASSSNAAPSANSPAATPLMVRHEIVNLPSASVLAVLRQQELGRKPAPKAVAVLADPVFDRHDSRLGPRLSSSAARQNIAPTRSTHSASSTDLLLEPPSSLGLLTRSAADVGLSRNGALSLPRLRFSRREAEEIMAVTPEGEGKKAVDFDASRATATSPELSQYRIVHFATHGLLDSVHPELSGLVFSMVDKNGQPQNGFLELQDIYNLNLPADLVVLSACETGLGKEISGEGLVGLTRGFMYAGASRVMASLWKVSDAGTAALMAEFYRAIEKDGLAPAAALRAAQIKMWQQKRWHDPYYWAAFQLQGEWK